MDLNSKWGKDSLGLLRYFYCSSRVFKGCEVDVGKSVRERNVIIIRSASSHDYGRATFSEVRIRLSLIADEEQ